MEERIRIPSGSVILEGLMAAGSSARGVVITHPHPLYGGDMHNNVVETLVEAYSRAGFTTLRFNFRGVGGSGGAHGHGEAETEDVRSAARELAERGVQAVHLAGYSFGAWVNARALEQLPEIQDAVLVSPPVDFMDFSFLGFDSRVRLVITGDRDEIAGAAHVGSLVTQWNPEADFRVLPGTDHFYHGSTGALRAAVEEHLDGLARLGLGAGPDNA